MSNITPDKVIQTVREHMIGDGFEFVLDIGKSHGSYLHDALTGRDILDFYSCFASNPLGFNHPKMDQATADRLMQPAIHNITNSDLFTTLKAEFVETFFRLAAPASMKHLFLIAGGGLAVENALKAAFDWKAQKNLAAGDTHHRGTKIMHLRQAFHGRTGYTMSLTNTDPVKTDRFPKFDWPRIDNPQVVFPDQGEHHEDLLRREQKALAQARAEIINQGSDIAACIIEPIQGEGSDNHFRAEFLRELQHLCNENDILFIIDEIQTGMGLTGKMWCYEHFRLEPDMICFGKKTQVCGVLASDKIDEVTDNVFTQSGRINSTWGGNLVDMVRCARYLEIIDEDNLVENAAEVGKILLGGLMDLQDKYPQLVSNVRGRGLMCAFDMSTVEKRNALRQASYEQGVLILPCGEKSIRFRPILAVTADDIARGLKTVENTLSTL